MAKKSKKQPSLESQLSSDASSQNIVETVDDEQEGKLLSPQEHDICLLISEGDTIHSQRAQALLAIDEGISQIQAGQRAGLTKGQVRYWLGKYRKIRLEIFPETIVKKAEAELVRSQAETPDSEATSDAASGKAGKSKAKKSKKKKGRRKSKKKRKKPQKKSKPQKKKKAKKKSK